MKPFIVLTSTILGLLCLLTVGSLIFLPANISAEYWVRPTIIEKEAIASSLSSPRIILLGGSSTLFGIDAQSVERETGVPTVNFGLHAGLPLRRLLRVGDKITRKGDLLVLSLEQDYYSRKGLDWSPWALRNALAWDREDFNRLPLLERARAAFTGASPGLLFEQWWRLIVPMRAPLRDQALKPLDAVLADWKSGAYQTKRFEYSQFNFDSRGDIQFTDESDGPFEGLTGLEDAPVYPEVIKILAAFVAEQRTRGVTVAVAHHPFLIKEKPDPGWPAAEAQFRSAISSTGAILVDDRSELFLRPDAFFNMNGHLTSAARAKRTLQLVHDLQRLDLIPRHREPTGDSK